MASKHTRKPEETEGTTDRPGRRAVPRAALAAALDEILDPSRFADYCPNGLQVEGRAEVGRLATAVSASAATIRRAVALRADALLVHHGYFWRGEDPRVLGVRRLRLGLLLAADINLFAYHLPLDAHPELGNNACLAKRMAWPVHGRGGTHDLVFWGDLRRPTSAAGLALQLRRRLGRAPLIVGDTARPIRRVAWCTGAAQDELQAAIDLGADAFVSGEIAERTTHLARESGIVYAAAGHHATERDGVQALGQALARRLGIEHHFIDDPNPA